MSVAEANVLIAKLQALRFHCDGCAHGEACHGCNLSADTAADTLDDAIAAIRKFACT